MHVDRHFTAFVILASITGLYACSGTPNSGGGSIGGGGATSTNDSGGSTSAAGGSSSKAGGASSTGGKTNVIGTVGGDASTGGTPATGGVKATGGAMSTGGAPGTGGTTASCHAAGTLNVTNQATTAYVIDGTANPTLTLCRGSTYTFAVNTPGHPFYIKTVQGSGTANAYSTGVTGNGATAANVTFIVGTSAPDTLFYDCSLHAAMTGTINIVN